MVGDDAFKKVAAFSLVEVTIAIGIFAFVIVGILGLLPTGMRLRAESARESRAVLIQQELIDAIKASPSVTNVVFVRDGPRGAKTAEAYISDNGKGADITLGSSPVLVGYPGGTTVPYFLSAPGRKSGGGDPRAIWQKGTQVQPVMNDLDIQTIALLSATNVAGMTNLYEVSIKVRSPASTPLRDQDVTEFRTMIYSP